MHFETCGNTIPYVLQHITLYLASIGIRPAICLRRKWWIWVLFWKLLEDTVLAGIKHNVETTTYNESTYHWQEAGDVVLHLEILIWKCHFRINAHQSSAVPLQRDNWCKKYLINEINKSICLSATITHAGSGSVTRADFIFIFWQLQDGIVNFLLAKLQPTVGSFKF